MPNECHALNVCEKISKQNFYTNFWYFYTKKEKLKKTKILNFIDKNLKFNNWTDYLWTQCCIRSEIINLFAI